MSQPWRGFSGEAVCAVLRSGRLAAGARCTSGFRMLMPCSRPWGPSARIARGLHSRAMAVAAGSGGWGLPGPAWRVRCHKEAQRFGLAARRRPGPARWKHPGRSGCGPCRECVAQATNCSVLRGCGPATLPRRGQQACCRVSDRSWQIACRFEAGFPLKRARPRVWLPSPVAGSGSTAMNYLATPMPVERHPR